MKINELYKDNEHITLESYLKKCGVISDIKTYLKPQFFNQDLPSNYINMDKATEMFIKHFNNLTPSYIICDSDLDGITSTVLMYQYMKALNKEWDIKILIHEGKERGLQDEKIFQEIENNPRSFLIIPDSGTNDKEQSDILFNKYNIDILVLDHHDIENPITNGVLINNQNPLNKNISKNGSGCLVTYMFLKNIDNKFDLDWTEYLYDLVALSLVSDVMDMTDLQNREFYHFGLETISCIQNEFLLDTFLKFIGNKEYTQRDIAFKIVPKFNSVIRTKNQELKYNIIKAFCNETDKEKVLDLCAKCHSNQIKTVTDIIENNKDEIDKISNNKLVVFSCEEMPKSYSGLVAGKIMDICGKKPTIVGKIIDGELVGSLRSPIPLRSDLNDNQYVEWAMGHENSCGVSIKKENLQSLIDYYNSLNLSYEPHIDVLKSYTLNSIPEYLYDEFGGNTSVLWGQGIPNPLFEIHDILFYPENINILGKNERTLKLTTNNISFLIFNATNQDKVNMGLGYIDNNKFNEKISKNKLSLSCIGNLSLNIYKGYVNKQMIIDKFVVKTYKPKTIDSVFKKR